MFTGRFPYGDGEAVLSRELAVIAPRFGRIFIVPTERGDVMAPMPGNVIVSGLLWSPTPGRGEKVRSLICLDAARVGMSVLGRPGDWVPYVRRARAFADLLATGLNRAAILRKWIELNDLRDAIYYDFWFENTTLALALLRREGLVSCAVARAHGFDVFDWRWEELRRVPFRAFKARELDAVFAISADGAAYMRKRLGRDRSKVHISRLGVAMGETEAIPASPVVPTIVSCSRLIPSKHVDRIPAVLARLGRPVHWVHFGDGRERGAVEAAASGLPSQVTWELKGAVPNVEVTNYYRTSPVAAFLSLSEAEGIPVSMMEAQSYGIPIVALDAGGIREIVLDGTGSLLDLQSTEAEIVAALEAELTGGDTTKREQIQASFARNFGAERNYGSFVDSLLALAGRESSNAHEPSAITVTTVLYNSVDDLERYAHAIEPGVRSGSVRCVAVDNASPDDSAEHFGRLLPDAQVIASKTNLGFARACNLAWPDVSTRYWMLLNPDVEAKPADLASLAAWMDDNPGVGAASPLLRGTDGSATPVSRAHDSLWRPIVELLRLHRLVPEPLRSRLMLAGRGNTVGVFRGWVPGAALIVRREAALSAGLLDEGLFMYGEDREWCWRFSQRGWQIAVCPNATLVHAGGSSARATWGDTERVRREVSGHLQASAIMRGRTYTSLLALVLAGTLGITSLDRRLPVARRSELKLRARAYLRSAIVNCSLRSSCY